MEGCWLLDWWAGSTLKRQSPSSTFHRPPSTTIQSQANRRPTMWSRVVSAPILRDIICFSVTNKDAKSQKKLNTYIWNVHLFVIKNYVHWASAFLNHLAGCFLPKMKKNVKFFWPCQWANFYGVRLFLKIVNISFNFNCDCCQLWQLIRQSCDFLWIQSSMREFFAFQGLHLQIILYFHYFWQHRAHHINFEIKIL